MNQYNQEREERDFETGKWRKETGRLCWLWFTLTLLGCTREDAGTSPKATMWQWTLLDAMTSLLWRLSRLSELMSPDTPDASPSNRERERKNPERSRGKSWQQSNRDKCREECIVWILAAFDELMKTLFPREPAYWSIIKLALFKGSYITYFKSGSLNYLHWFSCYLRIITNTNTFAENLEFLIKIEIWNVYYFSLQCFIV